MGLLASDRERGRITSGSKRSHLTQERATSAIAQRGMDSKMLLTNLLVGSKSLQLLCSGDKGGEISEND